MRESDRRVNILGVGVSAIDMAAAIATIDGWIRARQQAYVCVTPAHAVMDCRGDEDLRHIYNRSGMTTPDGMAIVWLLRLRGQRGVGRVYGPDLVHAVCEAPRGRRWRHFLLGGVPGVPERMAARLQERHPGVAVVGTLSPPFHEPSVEEDEAVVRAINAAEPDLVWVGLGSPKQERWMAAHVGRVTAPVLIGVGAAFDYLSGRKPQAPRWLQRVGLEWLFRWVKEPVRLAPRYRRYPLFVILALMQTLGLARFECDACHANGR